MHTDKLVYTMVSEKDITESTGILEISQINLDGVDNRGLKCGFANGLP